MKNVAATSGQSVSFAALFFAVGIAREGSWAGSDNVLNFYSRPPWTTLAPHALSEFAIAEYKLHHLMQEKNGPRRKFFSALPQFSLAVR
jgi:hypothetical protein